jgi:hypothetical protein
MSARTGLRYGELPELVWRDITLNGENSHVLVRASISKRKGGPHPFDSGMGGITR